MCNEDFREYAEMLQRNLGLIPEFIIYAEAYLKDVGIEPNEENQEECMELLLKFAQDLAKESD